MTAQGSNGGRAGTTSARPAKEPAMRTHHLIIAMTILVVGLALAPVCSGRVSVARFDAAAVSNN
jgi:hypothetical protein